MNFRHGLWALRARINWIAGATVCGVLGAAGLALVSPKAYVATASLVVDVDAPAGVERAAAPFGRGHIATQVDIASSHAVARKVVERLSLDRDAALRAAFMEEALGHGRLEDWIAARLREDLSVESLPDSRVMQIAYRGKQPQRVARIADAFADAYIETNLELRTEAARRARAWREQTLEVLRLQMELAQERFAQKRSGDADAVESALQVENAQRAYEAALQQMADSANESRASQTSVSILSRAVAPSVPAHPQPLTNAVVGGLLGWLAGVVFVLLGEMLNRRIHTEVDVAQGLGVPCLGVLEKAGV